jgi:Xaa-Pro dipeptidase
MLICVLFVVDECHTAGWDCAINLVGHIVSEFSHIQIYGDLPENRIWAQNTIPMSAPGKDGKPRYWILEIHLVDKAGLYGGFFEDLLI